MRPRFNSILSRIIWLHVLAIAVAAIVLPVAVYQLLSSTATSLQNRTLQEHGDTIAGYLKWHADRGWVLDLPADLRTLYAHSYDGFAFAVVDATGKVLFSSLPGSTPILAKVPHANDPSYFQLPRDKAVYYGASIPERRDGHTVWIQVAQDLEHPDVIIDDVVADFLNRVGWIVIPILLFLFAVDFVIVRRALAPVVNASEMARAIAPSRIDLRLPVNDLPREILPLVNAVNQALDRLEQGFRSQQEFTADAAHELRTPLTVLRARIDMLADKVAAQALRAGVDEMSRIVNQLLDIAELESFVVGPEDVADIHGVCAEVVTFIAPLALAQNKNVALLGASTAVWVRGNAETLFRAIRNLVENAISHTAPHTIVEVQVDPNGVVRVLDAGPGVPEDERELIFRRFWRRDRRRSGSAGLGLSIVSRIAEAHAAKIAVLDREHGGAAFTLSLHLVEHA